MKIAIIGKVNPNFDYDEWESKLLQKVKAAIVKQINITIGNGTLNQYARKYAAANDIPIMEYTADYNAHGDEATLIRNQKLVGDSDLIVGFLPQGSAVEPWICRPGVNRDKRAVVITC